MNDTNETLAPANDVQASETDPKTTNQADLREVDGTKDELVQENGHDTRLSANDAGTEEVKRVTKFLSESLNEHLAAQGMALHHLDVPQEGELLPNQELMLIKQGALPTSGTTLILLGVDGKPIQERQATASVPYGLPNFEAGEKTPPPYDVLRPTPPDVSLDHQTVVDYVHALLGHLRAELRALGHLVEP